ncbi:MAG: hypothetical protein ACK559_28440, partial [bacterium]
MILPIFRERGQFVISLERGWIKFVCDTHRLDSHFADFWIMSEFFRMELFATFPTESKSSSNSFSLFWGEYFDKKHEYKGHQLQKNNTILC